MKKTLQKLSPEKLQTLLASIMIIASIIIAGVFLTYFLNFNDKISSSNSDWGTFGDFIGGTLNPILSFLGLIALLLTIALQSKEIELTRNELELTRNELERTASAQEKTEAVLGEQSKTQIRQQFEGTFFALLEQHNKALEKISEPSEKWHPKKSDLAVIRESVILSSHKTLADSKKALESKNDLCGHYFRILYQILKFISTKIPESKIGDRFNSISIQEEPLATNEKMYSNILRSFLSYDITQVLAINCYCQDPNDPYWNFKLLIERYAFLEHMPFHVGQRNLELLSLTKEIYDPKAFGNSQFTPAT